MSDSDEWEEAIQTKRINTNTKISVLENKSGVVTPSKSGNRLLEEPEKVVEHDKSKGEESEEFSIIFKASERGLKLKELEKMNKEKEKEAIRKEREIVVIQNARKFEFGDKVSRNGCDWLPIVFYYISFNLLDLE
jgi:hypothetical protein